MGDQTNAVSYKVYLYKQEYANPKKDSAIEVRRIAIDRDVSTSLTYLKEKLATVFTVLKQSKVQFSILWEDEECEWIKIGTDEELMIALTEMSGPIYKLHIQYNDDGPHKDEVPTSFFDLLTDPAPTKGKVFSSKSR